MNDFNEFEKNTEAGTQNFTANTNKKSKKGGTAKKVFGTIGLGILFGLAASATFTLSNAFTEKVQKKFGANEGGNAIESALNDAVDEVKKEIPEDNIQPEEKPREEKPKAEKMNKSDEGMNVSQVVAEAMPSIVAITNKSVQEIRSMYGMGVQQYEAESAGSGIIIGQNDTELLVVTNAHVVNNADTLTVCFINEEAYEAQIKGADTTNDLAVVAVSLNDISGDTLDSIKIAKIGDSDKLEIGEQVVAIGNALGYGQSVTTGIVSALNRSIDNSDDSTKYIQTDAAINPGNSGGALLNMEGELIGINSAKLANTKIEGMGYAIPISAANPIMEGLMNMVTRSLVDESEAGYLGISGFSVTDEVAMAYNIPKGVYVSETTDGSAAQKAGLQKGDVIVKFDNMGMDSINKLKERLGYYKAGETVEVVIARADDGEYKEKTINVTLDSRRNDTNKKSSDDKPKADKAPEEDSNEDSSNQQNDGQKSGEFNIGGNSFRYSIPNDIFGMFGW